MEHFVILTAAGILAGLVNFFYLYLNLPTKREEPSAATFANKDWELPKLTYWLALCGYIVIGLAGAYLTPLVNAIVELKGLGKTLSGASSTELWVMFGYGLALGFSSNRLLSSISNNILTRIESIISAKQVSFQNSRFFEFAEEDTTITAQAKLSFEEIKEKVAGNNNSPFSTELIIAVCWAESSFDPSARATPPSTSKGLMMMNNQAIDTVNRNTPSGINFTSADMLIAEKAIACGTWYLKILYTKPDWGSQGDKRKTLKTFRGVTDFVYADKIIACEGCLQSTVVPDPQACLDQIHT